jgi:hypothetical protein
MEEFLRSLGVCPIDYIPVSGYRGDNILSPSPSLAWFGGKPLIEAMDSLENAAGIANSSLRFPIQDVYKFDERRIIAGRIERGALKVGEEIAVYPSGRRTRVRTLEFWAPRDARDVIGAGESVGITVEDEFFNRRGEIITKPGAIPTVSNKFRANLFWMGSRPASRGRKYKIKIATDEVGGKISEILRVIDASTLGSAKSGDEISMNDVAEVVVETDRPIVFDPFSDCAPTGRFVVVEDYDVAGGGIIISGESGSETSRLFSGNGISLDCDIFREFYFNLEGWDSGNREPHCESYAIGDGIPLKGESYGYPEDFDVILAAGDAAVIVRDGKLSDIRRLGEYKFGFMPVIDGHGFAINAINESELSSYLEDFRKLDAQNEKKFFERWLRFGQYRTMIFHSGFWSI